MRKRKRKRISFLHIPGFVIAHALAMAHALAILPVLSRSILDHSQTHGNQLKSIKIYQNPSKINQHLSRSSQIARTSIKVACASARARAIHFYIYSVSSFHLFDPVIFVLGSLARASSRARVRGQDDLFHVAKKSCFIWRGNPGRVGFNR